MLPTLPRPPRSFLPLLIALSVCLVAGCGGSLRMADDPIVLHAPGPVEIDVESFNGNVIIDTDERLEWATVRITRTKTLGHLRPGDLYDDLALINYSAYVKAGEIGPRLEVRTMTDSPEPHYHRAHVHITVPRTEGVRVRTTRGDVRARGVRGPIDVHTTDGDVRIVTNEPVRSPVTIINSRGNVDFRVRSESTGRIDAEAVNGRIVHRVRRGHFTIAHGTTDRRLYGTLNRGDNPITLRTVQGDIRFAVQQNPEDFFFATLFTD